MESKKFVNLTFYAISLIMAAIALLMTTSQVSETIDSEIFSGIALMIVIVLGLMNTQS
jgi:hypothetical protein